MRALTFILLGLALQAAQLQPGTVEGVVLWAGSTPLSGALVRVSQAAETTPNPFSAEATTDSNGRFMITNLPTGVYSYEITKDGFGSAARSASIITVVAGQRVRIPDVSLSMLGAIRGRVLDAEDKGMSSVAVEILRLVTDEAGRRVWAGLPGRNLTNTAGEYRITSTGSGDYYVRVVLDSGPSRLLVYYPATAESSKAAPVIVPEGGDVIADIRVGSALSGEGYLISGKVTLPRAVEVAAPFIVLALRQRDPNGPVEPSSVPYAQTSIRAVEGVAEFELRNVRPGNYEISARSSINARTYSATAPVEVRGRDLEGVELVLQPPAEVKGRLVIDGAVDGIQLISQITAARLQPSRVLNSLPIEGHAADVLLRLGCEDGSPGDLRTQTPIIDSTGISFSFREVDPGDCKITATLTRDEKPASQGLYIADIRAGGRSVMDSGFKIGIDAVDAMEIVVGTQGGSVEGRVTGDSGGDSSVTVVLIPEKSRRDNPALYRTASLSIVGPFRIEGLAPGNYQIFAISGSGQNPMRGVGSIARYESRAVSVTVQKGKTSSGIEVPCLSPEK